MSQSGSIAAIALVLVKLLVLRWRNRRFHVLNCLSFLDVNYVVLWNSSSYQKFKIDSTVGLGLA